MRKMVLVADAGVLVSAMAYFGLETAITMIPSFEFLVTRKVTEELVRVLTREMGMQEELVQRKISEIHLTVVEDGRFLGKMKEAERLIGQRDMSDVPTVALALAVENDGIWSTDKDFKDLEGVTVWNSRKLFRFAMSEPGAG